MYPARSTLNRGSSIGRPGAVGRDDLTALNVGVVEQRPAEELERLAPGIDELWEAVAVGVLYFPIGEVVAAEDRAQRPASLDQDRVEHLGSRGVVRMLGEVGQNDRSITPFRQIVDQSVLIIVDTVVPLRPGT